jgi:hypothetical protein
VAFGVGRDFIGIDEAEGEGFEALCLPLVEDLRVDAPTTWAAPAEMPDSNAERRDSKLESCARRAVSEA